MRAAKFFASDKYRQHCTIQGPAVSNLPKQLKYIVKSDIILSIYSHYPKNKKASEKAKEVLIYEAIFFTIITMAFGADAGGPDL